MGSGISSTEAELLPVQLYELSLGCQQILPPPAPCVKIFELPDVGIDDSLLKYSGLESHSALQTYSSHLMDRIPDFIGRLGSSLGAFTPVPNAVGLGALVLSMVMEICTKGPSGESDDSYNMLQRVFGEEKASSVRDTVHETVRRHRRFMIDQKRLLEELKRLEPQLSSHLTSLKNSLLLDGQMSTRGLKIWVNGASFHIQMMIHEARLTAQSGQASPSDVATIRTAIDEYSQDLGLLLPKYQTFKTSKTSLYCESGSRVPVCCIEDIETGWKFNHCSLRGLDLSAAFMKHVFLNYPPITGLKSHFSNIKTNLTALIEQRSAFTLPPRSSVSRRG